MHRTKDVRKQKTDMAHGTVQFAAIVNSFPSHYFNQPCLHEYVEYMFEILNKYDIPLNQFFENYLFDSFQITYITTLTDMYLERIIIKKVSDMIPATSGHAMTDDTARTNKQVYLPSGTPRR